MKKTIFFFTISLIYFSSCKNESKEITLIEKTYDNGDPKVISFFLNDTLRNNKIKEINYFSSKKKKNEINYFQGKKNGVFYAWFENGNLAQTGRYKNGIKDSAVIDYYNKASLQKKIERFYKKDSLVLENRYYENGVKEEECYFENGRERKDTWWYSNGSKEIEILESWNGLETRWYRNGAKEIEGRLKNGERNGTWLCWDSLGVSEPSIKY